MARHETSQCDATTREGNRCRARARRSSRFCFFHDPECTNERHSAAKAGGIERSRPANVLPADTPQIPLQSAADVIALLGETIHHVRCGRLDPRISNAVGYLASILLRAMEQSALEQRLCELEAAVRSPQRDTQPFALGGV